MSGPVAVYVDGKRVECEAGTSIMEAAAEVGIEIPSLCYLKGYEAQSSCSLCLVEVENRDGLVLACSTKVTDDMKVTTESKQVAEARKTCLELLFSDHAGTCVGTCTNACPADLAISGFLDQVECGNDSEALTIIREALALPAVLGHVCAGYCESACLRKHVDEPVSIRRLHGDLAEANLAQDKPSMPPIAPATGKRLAIVGAGPTGLSAAFYALQLGHECVVHDANAEAGGLLRYSMDEDFLPRAVLDSEVGLIEAMGAQFKLSWRLGEDATLSELHAEYDAVLLATGAGDGEKKIPVTDALKTMGMGDKPSVDKKTGLTGMDGVFVAGEVVYGSSKVVRAVASGRTAAAAMDQWLEEGVVTASHKPFVFRSTMTTEERDAFFEVDPETGFAHRPTATTPTALGSGPELEAEPLIQLGVKTKAEASRCLDCTCMSYDNCKLRVYADRYNVNQKRFSGVRRTLATDRSHPEVDYEPGKCILCGLCILVADEVGEQAGVGFSGRGFDVRLTLPFGEALARGLDTSAQRCAEVCPVGAITLKPKAEPTR